jgi:hypothetical protein
MDFDSWFRGERDGGDEYPKPSPFAFTVELPIDP